MTTSTPAPFSPFALKLPSWGFLRSKTASAPITRLMEVLLMMLLCASLLTLSTLSHANSGAGEPKKEEHGGGKGKDEKKAERPKRTFEGIEPLFYLDEKRKPFAEPFHKKEGEEFYLCRANVGEWYRQMNADDFNTLAEKNGLAKISGSTCALHLVPSNKGKKLPYILLEFYTSSDSMRECTLTEECGEVRTVIMYIKDKTLFRNFIITDSRKRVHKQYCLDNKSEIIAEKACWRYFQDLAYKKREDAEKAKEEEAQEEKPKRRRSTRKEE